MNLSECPGCGELHDQEPCRLEAADCDCCRDISGGWTCWPANEEPRRATEASQ